MDYTLNRTHAKILLGYLLVIALFGFFFITDYADNNQLTGYVILEEGIRVSTEKMDAALIEEIQSGDTQVKVLLVLEDNSATMSSNLDDKAQAIEENQEQAIGELQNRMEVSVQEEQEEIITLEGKASEEEIQAEINNDRLPDAEQLIGNQNPDLIVTQEYQTLNAIAVEVKNGEALAELANSDLVKEILLDYPVSISLDQSASQINAPLVWNTSVNGVNIDGSGETVCIIDTGIDYTHPALGGCHPLAYEIDGTPQELSEPIESSHPYSDNFDQTWTITQENFSQIALHFRNLSLETLSSGDSLDRVYIYDKDYRTLAMYKESLSDFWTPAGEGDTIYVRLVSDGSVTNYGFLIDQVLDGNTNTNLRWEECSKVIGGWDAYNNDPDPKDDHGHGTHVAGIISSNDPIYRGVAPGAKLVAVKALSSGGSGYSSDVIAGIDWCNHNAKKYGILVISMSLGCEGYSCTHYQENCPNDLTATSITAAYQQNISVFIAAGNSGWTNGISNPACVPHAIPVGGANENDQILFNRGLLLKILAPSTNIRSSVLNEGWNSLSGTSMATPHAAGAAALLQQYWKQAHQQELAPDEIQDKLFSSGKKVSDSGSGLNFSRIDIYATIQADRIEVNLTPNITNTTNLTNTTSPDSNFTLTLYSPLNNSYLNSDFEINLSSDLTKMNLSSWGYEISKESEGLFSYHNDSLVEIPFSHSNRINLSENNLSDGDYQINLYWNYEEGSNYSQKYFFILDTIAPQIEINYSPETVYANENLEFRINISEANIDSERNFLLINNGTDDFNYTINFSEDNISELSLTNLTENSTIYYQVFSTDRAGNIHFTPLSNISILPINLNKSVEPEESNNTTNITTPTNEISSITSPLPQTILEVGNYTLYNASSNLTGEISYLWDFGDGSNSSSQNGNKQYNVTGGFLIILNISNSNQSMLLNSSIYVNDTQAPQIVSMSYPSILRLESARNLAVNFTLFDYSNISSLQFKIEDFARNLTLQRSNNYFFSVTGLTPGNYTFYLKVKDNSVNQNSKNYSYSFKVSSCSDGMRNGNEEGIDCGGSCNNCTSQVNNNTNNNNTGNITTNASISITNVVTSAPTLTISNTAPIIPSVKKTEEVISTQAVLSAPLQVVQQESKPLNWNNDLKETKVNKQEKALYLLGGIVILLLGLYVGLSFKNNSE